MMNRYEDCQRCGAVDGQRVFSHDTLDVWAYLCSECYELCKQHHQPERSKREDCDKYFGMKAEFKSDGLCYFEDGKILDPNQPIADAVL